MNGFLPIWATVLIAVVSAIGASWLTPYLLFRGGRQKLESDALAQRAAIEGEAVTARAQLEADAIKARHDEKVEDREQARLDFAVLLTEVTKQRDEAFRKIETLDAKFVVVEMEVHGLRLARDLDPFPNWIVDLEGAFLYLNPEFEKAFLEPMDLTYKDMIGQKHNKIFPPDFVTKLHQLDVRARRTPDKSARMKAALRTRQVVVHKFAICVKGAAVAFAGYITEMEELESVTGK